MFWSETRSPYFARSAPALSELFFQNAPVLAYETRRPGSPGGVTARLAVTEAVVQAQRRALEFDDVLPLEFLCIVA